jgi:predicted dehydrogenase
MTFREKLKADWPVYSDYRQVLDRKDIDAVIVATGEFQRIRPCIEACMAGKDIYAEKPLSLYIQEGRALVTAARKAKRIVQVGTQQRSMEMNRIACALIRNGGLGKLLEVRAIAYKGPQLSPSEPFPSETPPAGFDWNMWLNQAADRPFNSKWMGWMQWHDFAGGEMTNWGAHGVDQIQWALGMDHTGPVELEPLTQGLDGQVRMKYANGVVVNYVIEPGKGPMGGAVFICERGKLASNSIAPKKNASGATHSLSGKPDGICRIGSIASSQGNSPSPMLRSVIVPSRSAIWPISPENCSARCDGIRPKSNS